MAGTDADRLELGGLWRDVVNFLGNKPITPDALLPLLDAVVPRWASWTYFLGQLSKKLVDRADRRVLAHEVSCTSIGYRIWSEQRDALTKWAASSASGEMSDDQMADWWLRRHPEHVLVDQELRLCDFAEAVKLARSDRATIDRLAADRLAI